VSPTIMEILLLLAVSNGAPVLARKLFADRFDYPLDLGKRFFDGRPVFGASKTIRGILASLLMTVVIARLMGFSLFFGIAFAALTMLGDLLSSFTKRRMGLAPSSRAYVLDQIPESLLPSIFAAYQMGLGVAQVLVVVILFFVLEVTLSPLFYKLGIRRQPY
jgi:CDP-2,3-bis-(O-geranylgeranyl)-sn-glycerol synthase